MLREWKHSGGLAFQGLFERSVSPLYARSILMETPSLYDICEQVYHSARTRYHTLQISNQSKLRHRAARIKPCTSRLISWPLSLYQLHHTAMSRATNEHAAAYAEILDFAYGLAEKVGARTEVLELIGRRPRSSWTVQQQDGQSRLRPRRRRTRSM